MAEKRIQIATLVVFIVIIFLALGPSITGFFVFDETQSTVVENINHSFSNSEILNWTPLLSENQQISSVKISGSFQKIGNLTIFLIDGAKEFILYNSSEEDETEISPLTGFFVMEKPQKPEPQPVQEEPEILSEPEQTQESEPAEEEQPAETEEQPTNETQSEPENQTIINENATQTNETIEQPLNQTILLPENQTLINKTNQTQITEPNQTILIPENQTQPNETIEEPENQTIELPENQTNETLINETNQTIEQPEEEKSLTISFEDNCGQACFINITNTNLKLRIQTQGNVSGILEKITYTIIEKKQEENVSTEKYTIENLIQHKAEIGKKVKWTQTVQVNSPGAEVTLPKTAEQIKVFNKTGKKEINSANWEVLEVYDQTAEFGAASARLKEKKLKINSSGKVEIEYFTEAPQISETQIAAKRKQVTISSETHYENILTYTSIPETQESKIRLYLIQNNQKLPIENFERIDTNNNSLIDKIQWIVPHLSSQTYEIVIEITKAEHLDENKTFISDIYDEVKALDNAWSESIYSNEYIRVVFEKELDNSKDITLYPKVISGKPKIQVFEKNKTELLATFSNISEGKNTVYLTSLNGTQDTFDLKILNGTIQIDYIVDPTTALEAFDQEDDSENKPPPPAGFSEITVAPNEPAYFWANYTNDTGTVTPFTHLVMLENISWYASSTLSSAVRLEDAEVYDVDLDNDNEIITVGTEYWGSNYEYGGINILEYPSLVRSINLSYQNPTTNSPTLLSEVELSDIDNDGVAEIIVSGYTKTGTGTPMYATVEIYNITNGELVREAYNNEAPYFSNQISILTGMDVGDVYGTGEDLIVVSTREYDGSDYHHRVIIYNYTGTSIEKLEYITPLQHYNNGNEYGYGVILLPDLDNNGENEIVSFGGAYDGSNYDAILRLFNTSLELDDEIVYSVSGYHTFFREAAYADVDNDGVVELVVVGQEQTSTYYKGIVHVYNITNSQLVKEMSYTYDPGKQTTIPGAGGNPKPFFQDTDSDGDLEIITGWNYDSNTGFSVLLLNVTSSGLEKINHSVYDTSATELSCGIVGGDLDGNGFPEIVAAGSRNGAGGTTFQYHSVWVYSYEQNPCNIWINDTSTQLYNATNGWYKMRYDSATKFYNYTANFTTEETFAWNISCNKQYASNEVYNSTITLTSEVSCTDAGDCSGEEICINAVCRSACSATYDGQNCSDDSTNPYTNDGICTRNSGGTWSCDETEASYYSSQHYTDCSDTAYGQECDSGSLAGGYSKEGVCGDDIGTHDKCYTQWASSTTSSITSSSVFGTEAQVCAIGYNTYYCDDISDSSFSPGTDKCDGSEATCESCSGDNTDSSGKCESGCGAASQCDEYSTGYHCEGSSSACTGDSSYGADLTSYYCSPTDCSVIINNTCDNLDSAKGCVNETLRVTNLDFYNAVTYECRIDTYVYQENCTDKPSVGPLDTEVHPFIKNCTLDWDGCSAGDCTNTTYCDECDNSDPNKLTLNDYYKNGTDYDLYAYDCSTYDVKIGDNQQKCNDSVTLCNQTTFYCLNGNCTVDQTGSVTGFPVQECVDCSQLTTDGPTTYNHTVQETVYDYDSCYDNLHMNPNGYCDNTSYTDFCNGKGQNVTEYISDGGSGHYSAEYDCNNLDGRECSVFDPNNLSINDYSCSSGACTYSTSSSHDCTENTSTNHLDSGVDYTTPGYIKDYIGCAEGTSAGAYCNWQTYPDYCSDSYTLQEAIVSGTSFSYTQKSCSDYDSCTGGTDNQQSYTEYFCNSSNINVQTDPDNSQQQASSFCGTNRTADRDVSQSFCEATISNCNAYNWSIGGEVDASACCGNEVGSEYTLVRVAAASMDNSYSSNSADDACCSTDNKCVNNSVCYATTSNSDDIDGDGDNDYCNAGTWVDCNTDAECSFGYTCNASNDCTNSEPSVSNIVFNSTHATNYTTENLTAYFDASDPDSEPITNITDFRKSGTSIAVLNMPFDTNKTGDTTSGAIRDYSTYGNNGTINGDPDWTAGQVGGAYKLDGSGDYFDLGNPDSLKVEEGNFTVEAWWNIIESKCGTEIIHKSGNIICGSTLYGGWSLSAHYGKPVFRISDSVSEDAVSVEENQERIDEWVYAVGVKDGNTIYLYVNGKLIGSGDATGINIDTSYSLRIGGRTAAWNTNGTIDEVKIYNIALSPEQINASYQAGLAGHHPKTIVSQETSPEEEWSVAITPNDQLVDGTTQTSNTITIRNTQPTITVTAPPSGNSQVSSSYDVNWTASDPDPTETLTISCYGDADASGHDKTYTCFTDTSNDGTQTCDVSSWDFSQYYIWCNASSSDSSITDYSAGTLEVSTPQTDLQAKYNTSKPLNSELGKMELSWTDNSGGQWATQIWRNTTNTAYVNIANVSAGTTTYSDDNLNDNILYNYKVRTYSGSMTSDYSSTATNITSDRTPPESSELELANGASNNNMQINLSDNTEGLVLYAPFEEGAGTTTDDWSTEKHSGTLYNMESGDWISGKNGKGNAIKLDGVDEYVQFDAPDINAGDPFTFSAWFNSSGTQNAHAKIIANYARANIYLGTDDKLYFLVYNNSGYKSVHSEELTYNQWYYVSGVYNGSEMILYINGKNIAHQTIWESGRDFTSTMGIGRDYNDWTGYFNGTIDEVRIYNRSLTQEEIINDMQSGLLKFGLYRSSTKTGTYAPVSGPIYDERDNLIFNGIFAEGRNADDFTPGNSYGDYSITNEESLFSGYSLKINNSGDANAEYEINLPGNLFKSDTTYILSAYQKVTNHVSGSAGFLHWRVYYNDTTSESTSHTGPSGNEDWTRYYTTIHTDAGKTVDHVNVYIAYDTDIDAVRYIDGILLEEDIDGDGLPSGTMIIDNNYTDSNANDTTDPSEPTSLSSSSHVAQTWSSDNSIDISFTDAADYGNEYFYYSSAFDIVGNKNNILSNESSGTIEGDSSSYNFWQETVTDSIETGKTYILTWNARVDDDAYTDSDWVNCYFWGQNDSGTWKESCASSYTGTSYSKRSCTMTADDPDSTIYKVGCYHGPSGETDGIVYVYGLGLYEVKNQSVISGVDGYDVGCNTPPGTTKDIEEGGSATSACTGISDGTFTYYLRSVDNAGNWDDSYATSPEYWICTDADGVVNSDGGTYSLSDSGTTCGCDSLDVQEPDGCDTDVSGSLDGVCTDSNGDDASGTLACTANGNEICDDGTNFAPGCSACDNLDPCDKSLASATYTQDGICCSSSCVGSDSSDCCTDSDCAAGEYCNNYQCTTCPSDRCGTSGDDRVNGGTDCATDEWANYNETGHCVLYCEDNRGDTDSDGRVEGCYNSRPVEVLLQGFWFEDEMSGHYSSLVCKCNFS